MTASILEDAENLTAKGKLICGILCILGVGVLIATTSLIVRIIPEKYKNLEVERQALTLLPSKPQELDAVLAPVSEPLTPTEQSERRGKIENKLDEFEKILVSQGYSAPIYLDDLIEDAVCAGLLHPLDVDKFSEEARIFRSTKTEEGWKTQPIVLF